jgi:magnesium-transporting ATPase (P-type)
MSLIIETEEKDYFIFCKGADSIVLPRCKFATKEENDLQEKTYKDLYSFAVEGLRTLVMGKK